MVGGTEHHMHHTVLKDDHGVSNEFSGSSSNLSLSLSPSRLSFELGFQSVRILKDVEIPVEMKRYQQSLTSRERLPVAGN